MLLFTVDFLKEKGESVDYEFSDVDRYLKVCEKYQPEEYPIDNSLKNVLNELLADLTIFEEDYDEIYIFFNVLKMGDMEVIHIYDYSDTEYKIEDTKENYAKIKGRDALKLILFELGEK